jgi:Tfp pilus assembly protein PilN
MAAETTNAEQQSAEMVFEEKPIPGYVRVDLLPEKIIQKMAVRKARNIAIALLLIASFIIIMWRLYLQLQINSAEEELLRAQATGAQLEAEIAKYSEIPPIFLAAEQGQQSLTLAMSREVRWSFLLNQLSFSTPAGVTLESIGGQIIEAGSEEASPGGVYPLQPSEGTMTFTGSASSYNQVAAWLDSLTGLQDYTYPFMATASKGDAATDGTTTGGAVTWDSTANLSPNALSGRYTAALPGQAPAPGTAPAPGATPAPSAPATSQPGGTP